MSIPQNCQAEACAIQDCLGKYNYNEAKCQSYVAALYRCCDTMYKDAKKRGVAEKDAKSTACPIRSVVERRIKRMKEEEGKG